MAQMTFASACLKFFGKLPGQSLQDFSEELKALTPEDKQELAELLNAEGFELKK